jgi:ABC-type polysaccharide/polyol phosphate transport system ATPase subunit
MKNNKDIAITLTNVSKKYLIHHEKPTLMERLIKRENEEYLALQKINIKIRTGERVGIVGLNGSGKTTLLKIISGISAPTTGRVKTIGKVVSLIDLAAGFHTDLTGLQNIYLNGMLLGMSKSEIKNKLEDIISFADIGRFIDTPLFTYSQGMQLRLGFSIAVYSDPDILIIDENIESGDQNFQVKSFKKISELIKKNKTVVFASHRMDLIRKMVTRVIWIDKSKIIADGPVKKVVSMYETQ